MRHLTILMWTALALVACNQKTADAQTKDEQASKTPAPAAAAQKTANADTPYLVRIVPGEATAGQQGTSVIEVSPAPGYKINLEFPARLKLEPTEGITHSKDQLNKDDAEVSEKVLRFSVGFTPKAAGKYALTGLADFSVCDDRTCKLIRGEKLSWEVAVK